MELGPTVLRQLDAFSLRTRRSVMGVRQGSHRSQRRGHGVEFAEYRNYEVGDNPRYIDWSLYARSDKLYVRRYLEEENVALYVIIDGSASLTHPQLRQKWQFASTLAACAGYVALSSQDPVTVSVLGHRHSAPFWGARAFRPMTSFLNSVSESLPEEPDKLDLLDETRRSAFRFKFPGVCLFISDFMYPLEDAIQMLAAFRSRNMEVHAVQVLGASDYEPADGSSGATLTDSESGETLPTALDSESRAEYLELLTAHNRTIREHCLSHGVQFVSTRVTEPFDKCAVETLTRMSLFV